GQTCLRPICGSAHLVDRGGVEVEEVAGDRSPLKIDGNCLYLDTIRVDEVRTPTAENQRTAEEVHVLELALAIEHVVRDAGSASYDEVMTSVRSVFGWGARRGTIEYRLQEATEVAVQDGRVEERGKTLQIPREERSEPAQV